MIDFYCGAQDRTRTDNISILSRTPLPIGLLGLYNWCAWRDLNPQHPVSKTGASTNWTTRAILLLKILFLYFVTPITFRSYGHAHLYMVEDPNQEVP